MTEEVNTDSSTGAGENPPATNQDDDLLKSLETPEPPAEVTLNDDTLKALESVDPAKLPESLRRKLELPFKQDHTKKTQELADDRKRVEAERDRLLGMVERLTSEKGITPTEDEKAALKDRIREGDNEAVISLMEKMLEEKVDNSPQMRTFSQVQAVNKAVTLMPKFPEYETEVAQVLSADPTLLKLATANKFEFAPQVLAGLAYQAHARKLEAYVAKEPDRIKEAQRKAIEAYKNKVSGAEPITTRAGSTPSRTDGENNGSLKSLRQIMEEELPKHVVSR